MTDEKEIIVKEFRDKFARLVAICDRLKSECVKLEASNKELEDKMKTRESDYQQLKLRYENMKTVVSLLDGKDKHDAKIYLNRIVRDIDKCLSMLLDWFWSNEHKMETSITDTQIKIDRWTTSYW